MFNNRLQFIDFVYDIEEFQNILGGEQYTCVYLINEKDPRGIDFLCALESLINNYNNWINFYYSFLNKLQDQSRDRDYTKKLLWIYKGSKKVVSIQLNNDKKMRQMDEIIQKLAQQKLQGSSVIRTSTIKQNSQITSQQSPDKRRSKSIRRLVEESQVQTIQNSNIYPSKLITRVQAKFVQREPSRGSVPENNDDYRITQQQGQFQNESIMSQQDILFRVVGELEEKEILDVTMSGLVKRLLIEENKEITSVLQSFLESNISIQQLCEKLNKIIENNTNQQRPTSPFQQLKQAKIQISQQEEQYQKESQNNSITQELSQLEEIRNQVIERNNQQFSAEQFGMANILWKNNDKALISLCSDVFQKIKKGEQPQLIAIQVYADSKFNELLSKHFKTSEINLIQEYKNNKSFSLFVVMQTFRYETKIDEFIISLRKAITNLQNLNTNFSQSQQQTQQPMQIKLFQYHSPKAVSPITVLGPGFPVQEDSPSPPLQVQINGNNEQMKQVIFPRPRQSGQSGQIDKQNENEKFKQEILSKSEQISPKKIKNVIDQNRFITKTANQEIFEEEHFMAAKVQIRKQFQSNLNEFYSTQTEKELNSQFNDMLWHMDLEEQKVKQLEKLFSENNNALYDIVKNYSAFHIVKTTRDDLLKLLQDSSNSEDYRKQKMYNLFMNQVRFFALQKHIKENEKNFLLKLFLDNDIQVLGTLEVYLQNRDAESMLESLQMIIKQYGKYINIPDLKEQEIPARKESEQPKKSKDIIHEFKPYFTAEEKMRLEQIANDYKDQRIEQYYQQYKQDQDLNTLINSLKQICSSESLKKNHLSIQFDQLLKQLQKSDILKIDDYMISVIYNKRNEQRIKGIIELYLFNKNQEELADNLKSISKLLQQELIDTALNEFYQQNFLNEVQLSILKEKAIESHKDYPKLLGAFSLYFEQAQLNEEEAKKEVLETLEIFCG